MVSFNDQYKIDSCQLESAHVRATQPSDSKETRAGACQMPRLFLKMGIQHSLSISPSAKQMLAENRSANGIIDSNYTRKMTRYVHLGNAVYILGILVHKPPRLNSRALTRLPAGT